MIVGQKNTKTYIFELVPDISKIREKWSLEKLVLWTKKPVQVDYFKMYRWETKFSYKNSYRKNAFMLSFPRNKLFLISETIRVIIYWHFCPKTCQTKNFPLTLCLLILRILMIWKYPHRWGSYYVGPLHIATSDQIWGNRSLEPKSQRPKANV